MKKIIQFVVLVNHFFSIHSQNNWANLGSEWIYSVPNEIGNPLFNYERFATVKDTIVEDKICKLIRSSYSSEIMYGENDRVYYWFKNKFRLIYDFSSNIDDTIVFEFKSFSPNSGIIDTAYKVKCIVEKIDTNNLGPIKLKRFTTSVIPDNSLNFLVWPSDYIYLEKIGYEYDFLYLLSIPSLGFMHNLRCFHDSELNFVSTWWKLQNKECNYSLINLSFSDKDLMESLNLYPNPLGDKIIIQIPIINEDDKYFIKIYDILGGL
jgi:hypothetical protein